ncbi:MAG: hypothetical protein HRU09_04690 [Oligoflexales bacterium]|nr:hypothetical protein [Oligoflexales bacterium]
MQKIFLLSLLGMSTVSFGNNPVGENASYKLDRSRSRTSSIIIAGSFKAKVTEHIPEGEKGPSYNNFYQYDLSLRILGRQKGEGNFELIEEVYTPEFIEKVKNEQVVTTEQFTAKYLVQEDVRTNDGSSYPASDYIAISDIDLSQINGLRKLVHQLFAANELVTESKPGGKPIGGDTGDLQNLVIKIAVHSEVPVLGGAKIDLSGIYQGVNFKAGFDYIHP